MNIGFINNFGNYPPRGGSSVHVYQLIKGFCERGHKVCALQGDFPYENYKRYDPKDLDAFVKDIDVLYLRVGGGLSQDKYTYLKKKCKDLPLIWELNSPAAERLNWRAPFVKMAWKWMAPMTDGVVCVSDELVTYARDTLGIKNAISIANGSDPDMFKPQMRDRSLCAPFTDDDFVVVWTGSAQFVWQGIDIIFKVAKVFEEKDKRVKFLIVTNPKYLKEPIGKNMHVIDTIPYLEIPKYIASGDAALSLHHDMPWSEVGFYGSPLKLFDYMASARPMVVSNLGQLGRVIKHQVNGLLTDNSVDDVVQKIMFLKDHPEEARMFGERAREDIIRHYNWDRVTDETLKYFDHICKKGAEV